MEVGDAIALSLVCLEGMVILLPMHIMIYCSPAKTFLVMLLRYFNHEHSSRVFTKKTARTSMKIIL